MTYRVKAFCRPLAERMNLMVGTAAPDTTGSLDLTGKWGESFRAEGCEGRVSVLQTGANAFEATLYFNGDPNFFGSQTGVPHQLRDLIPGTILGATWEPNCLRVQLNNTIRWPYLTWVMDLKDLLLEAPSDTSPIWESKRSEVKRHGIVIHADTRVQRELGEKGVICQITAYSTDGDQPWEPSTAIAAARSVLGGGFSVITAPSTKSKIAMAIMPA